MYQSFIPGLMNINSDWMSNASSGLCIIICDLLSNNPALPANIEFELEAILSVLVVFQVNSDYCTKVLQGACTVSYRIMKSGCAAIKTL